MKKPLLLVLVVGLIPIILLIVGLILSNTSKNKTNTDNYLYPTTDNALIGEDLSRNIITDFFTQAGKSEFAVNLFQDQTINVLRYDNIYETNLKDALNNIISIQEKDIQPFEVDSWTSQDHLYSVTYDVTLTDNIYSFLGTNGENTKIFLLSKIDSEWKISDITDVPGY